MIIGIAIGVIIRNMLIKFIDKKIKLLPIVILAISNVFIIKLHDYKIGIAILLFSLLINAITDHYTSYIYSLFTYIPIMLGVCYMLLNGRLEGILIILVGFLFGIFGYWLGMGWGDVELFTLLAVFLNMNQFIVVVLISVILCIIKILKNRQTIPFAPFLYAGTIILLLIEKIPGV